MLPTSEPPRPAIRISRRQNGQIAVIFPDALLDANLSVLGDWRALAVYSSRTSGLSQEKSEILLVFRVRPWTNKVRGERHLIKGIAGEHRAELMLPGTRIERSPISPFALSMEDIAWVPGQHPGKPDSVTLVLAVPRELLTYPVGTTAPLPLVRTPLAVPAQEPIVAGQRYDRPDWINVSLWRAQDRSPRRNNPRIGSHPRLSIHLSEEACAQIGWRIGETRVSISDDLSSRSVTIRPVSTPVWRAPRVSKKSLSRGGHITHPWKHLCGTRMISKRSPVCAQWTDEGGLMVILEDEFFVPQEGPSEAASASDSQDPSSAMVSARLEVLRDAAIVRNKLAALKSLSKCREVVLRHREDVLVILGGGNSTDGQVEAVVDALSHENLLKGVSPEVVRDGLLREIRALMQGPSGTA